MKSSRRNDRPSTAMTMRIPAGIVESRRMIALRRALRACRSLLESCADEGLHRDEARFDQDFAHKLATALKRRGVADEVI